MNGQTPSNLKNSIMQNFKGDIGLYINMTPPLEMQRGAVRSFRDFVKGNIDLDFEGQVFLNPYFMENTLLAYQRKYNQASIRCKSEEELLKDPEHQIPEKIIKDNLKNDQVTLQAYDIIIQALNKIYDTGDLTHMNEISEKCAGLNFDECIDYYYGERMFTE